MKYKITGLVSVILAFCIAAGGLLITRTDGRRVRCHQHIERQPYTACTDHGADVFCTHLPVICIDTGGEEIPGRKIKAHHGNKKFTTTSDGQSRITARVKVFDSKTGNNHLTDTSALESKAIVNVRGNSSRAFDKSNYSVRLITESGENNSQEMMGMAAHHEWVLHGPFMDKTLIRNYMWYNISGEIMEWAPNVRFCEVFINGEYNGVYVMTETVTAGKDGARLNISIDKKDNSFSGYILRLDRGSDIPEKNLNTFSQYTGKMTSKMNIVYPGKDSLTEKIKRAVELDCSQFEKSLYSFDFNHKDYGYRANIDTGSFADYFLINEITSNYDAGVFSTYIYKDLSNRYKMCVWDFNSVCDGYEEAAVNPHTFQLQNCPWFYMLTKDRAFVEQIIKRYQELRKTYFSDEYMTEYIDDTVAYLGPAIERNFEKWGYTFDEDYCLLIPHERDIHSYEEAVRLLKEYLLERADWMDKNIYTLKQYCEESKDKRFDENAN